MSEEGLKGARVLLAAEIQGKNLEGALCVAQTYRGEKASQQVSIINREPYMLAAEHHADVEGRPYLRLCAVKVSIVGGESKVDAVTPWAGYIMPRNSALVLARSILEAVHAGAPSPRVLEAISLISQVQYEV